MYNSFHSRQLLRICIPLSVALWVMASGAHASANPKLEQMAERLGVRILAEATSDKDIMNSAKAKIPFAKMSPRSRERTNAILSNMSQYRRMPSLQYEVHPEMYQYLISHPDVAISTWRVMGISELVMQQTGPFEYEASATDGSQGIADVLWRDGNQCLFIAEGKYQSPLIPGSIQASALVWLQYRFITDSDGKVRVNQQVETFIRFPSSAVDTLARLASVVTNSILDRNVLEVSLYAKMMSTAAEKEPAWIEQVAVRMDNVVPQRRQELIQIAQPGTQFNTVAGSSQGSSNSSANKRPAADQLTIRANDSAKADATALLLPAESRQKSVSDSSPAFTQFSETSGSAAPGTSTLMASAAIRPVSTSALATWPDPNISATGPMASEPTGSSPRSRDNSGKPADTESITELPALKCDLLPVNYSAYSKPVSTLMSASPTAPTLPLLSRSEKVAAANSN